MFLFIFTNGRRWPGQYRLFQPHSKLELVKYLAVLTYVDKTLPTVCHRKVLKNMSADGTLKIKS